MQKLAACAGIALTVALVGCAPVTERARLATSAGEGFASAGDIILRVDLEQDLPNAVSRADIFGRTRDRGFIEICYIGLNAASLPVFVRRDVDIVTNETTMSQTGGFLTSSARGNAQRTGGSGAPSIEATTIAFSGPQAQVTVLPPDSTPIVVDPSQGRMITVGKHGVEVLDATAAGVRYRAF